MQNRRRKRQRQDRAGFTLLEVLLVLVILVILGTMAGLAVNTSRKQAFKTNAQAQITMFADAIAHFEFAVRRYPTTQEGLSSLRTSPGSSVSRWNGPYINKDIPDDPWDNPYQYTASDGSYTITSNGPDGAAGTEDDITVSGSL